MTLSIKKEDFDQVSGIKIFTLENDILRIKVTNLGCRILEIYSPDKNGKKKDILLGLKDLNDYKEDPAYFGAVLGRVASRIKNARFNLNGKEYSLAANNAGNHLHGGIYGFDKKVFQVEDLNSGLRFVYNSVDGEEGYPGNLKLTVDYILEANSLIIIYEAETDQDTVANFTNHMYFNLSENPDYIGNHLLKIRSNEICCVDKSCMVTGDRLDVRGTIFDFNEEKTIEDAIHSKHQQIENARGLDHPFIICNDTDTKVYAGEDLKNERVPYQISLRDPESKRQLKIYTTAPAVQVYTGNYLADGCKGKLGKEYKNWSGIALETECLPNAINTEDAESVILRKESVLKSETIYTFSLSE